MDFLLRGIILERPRRAMCKDEKRSLGAYIPAELMLRLSIQAIRGYEVFPFRHGGPRSPSWSAVSRS